MTVGGVFALMSATITYEGYIDMRDDGACVAQLVELPGCYAMAATVEDALASVVEVIPDYYGWLQRHDEYTPTVEGPFAVTLQGIERVYRLEMADIGGFFAPDAEPLSGEDLDWYLSLLDWAYSDYIEMAVQSLHQPGVVQDPPNEMIKDDILHVAQAQLWLISRLEPSAPVAQVSQLAGSLFERLEQIRRASLARLRAASDDERRRLIEIDGERWALRCVLRCAIVHLREHTEALQHAKVG